MEYSVFDNLVKSDPGNACSPLPGSVSFPALQPHHTRE